MSDTFYRFISVLVVLWLIMYVVASVISGTFNISEWSESCRMNTGIAMILLTIMALNANKE